MIVRVTGPRMTGPGVTGPRVRGTLGWLALAATACSTLADTPDPEECRSDDDCAEGYVCAVDQGRCLPGNEAAPRAHLGFDIRERVASTILFRVEADGCDCTIEEEENIRELSLRRALVTQQFILDADRNEPEPDDAIPNAILEGNFKVTQSSRQHQSPSPLSISADYPTLAMDETMAKLDTVVRWPRYHPLDQNVPPDPVLWEITPTDPDLASRFVAILPPQTDAGRTCTVDADCCEPIGECNPAPNYCDTTVGQCSVVGPAEWTYRFTYDPRCTRGLEGDVVAVDPVDFTRLEPPLAEATVSLRHADGVSERLGIPVVGSDELGVCNEDDDCPAADQYCDPVAKQCFVSMAGRDADGSRISDAAGKFTAEVYIYCGAQTNVAYTRHFELTVKPEGPRPQVEFSMDVPFPVPLQEGVHTTEILDRALCVPDWGPGASLELAFTGQPRTLAGAEGEYTCCDVGCLPASADDAADGAPPVPESCDGRTSAGAVPEVSLESYFVLDDAALVEWLGSECAPPKRDSQGRAGSLSRTATCTAGEPCRADDVALGTASEPRTYRVRVESQPGSVLASGDFEIQLGAEPPAEVQTLMLHPRVLVTGVVDVDAAVCARRPTGADCAAREAVVLAERLRLPGEADGSVPGPHFHSVNTFYDAAAGRDGAFVLPLDPGGVYVVTALPLAGAEGGPAGYTLVDLRDEAPLEPLRLVLEDGVVVTLRLEQFDQRTTVIPIDRGSYLAPGKGLRLPGSDETAAPIDLNGIGACWTRAEEGPQGCKIRRLIPPGYDLARSQVGEVRFTARRSDAAQCTVRCPMSDPAE